MKEAGNVDIRTETRGMALAPRPRREDIVNCKRIESGSEKGNCGGRLELASSIRSSIQE
jgi:hypothetical protein